MIRRYRRTRQQASRARVATNSVGSIIRRWYLTSGEIRSGERCLPISRSGREMVSRGRSDGDFTPPRRLVAWGVAGLAVCMLVAVAIAFLRRAPNPAVVDVAATAGD